MLKAVFWDFGGVITTSPFEAFNRLEAARGLPKDFIRKVNSTNPLDNAWAKFESSRITAEEFDRLFEEESRSLGHPLPGREVLPVLSGDLRPRMVNALKLCREHFTIACLTNNVRSGEGPSMARSADRAAAMNDVMGLFHYVLESSKEGIRKPNPDFYLRACDRASVQPNQVVFLDDLGVNLKPAKDLGMQTIKVLNESQALADLSRATGLAFP